VTRTVPVRVHREFSSPEQLVTSLSDLGLESQAMLFTKDVSDE
jgi:hypothetical protein